MTVSIYLQRPLFRNRLRLPLEPVPCVLIIFKEVVSLLPNLRMVLIHPLNLDIRQEGWLDEVIVDGCHCNVLEAQPCLVAKVMVCLHFARHDDV